MNAARAHFDGKYRALNQYPLYRWKMAAGATYRNHLAFGLRELGFKVEQHGKDGEFTRIAGRAARARGALVQAAPPRLRRSPATTALTSPPTRSCTRPPTTSPARPSATRAMMRRSAPGGGRRRKRSRSVKRSSQSYAMSSAVISRLSGCASSPPGSSNYPERLHARGGGLQLPRVGRGGSKRHRGAPAPGCGRDRARAGASLGGARSVKPPRQRPPRRGGPS